MLFNPVGAILGIIISLFIRFISFSLSMISKTLRIVYEKTIKMIIKTSVEKKRRHVETLVSKSNNYQMPRNDSVMPKYEMPQRTKL